MNESSAADRRWPALIAVCLGALLIVLDATIVDVALPSMREDLKFTSTSLVWVVNAYATTLGGCVLLSGRLGDIYGQKRTFLAGIFLFTAASLACGLAHTQAMLIVARAVQGVGGAVVLAVSRSLIMILFENGKERAKALGVFGFVAASGGSIGLLLGGVLTHSLSWHWVFLVNVPLGMLVYGLCGSWLPNIREEPDDRPLDVLGAVTLTAGSVLTVYAIVNGASEDSSLVQTSIVIAAAMLAFGALAVTEARAPRPLLPHGFWRARSLMISSIIGFLWAAGLSACFFSSAQYLQIVLGSTPMEVALALLPCAIAAAMTSLGLSAHIISRFGSKGPLVFGLLLGATSLAMFSRITVDGNALIDIAPGMFLIGLGAGIASAPLALISMENIPRGDGGLASGISSTAALVGSALGLAILVRLSAIRTDELLIAGATMSVALTGGYRVAFLYGAGFSILAACIAIQLLHNRSEDRIIKKIGP